jgi:hypothetical protein
MPKGIYPHKVGIKYGTTGYHFSEETKKKLSLLMKGNKNALGCKRSEETRIKMSEVRKGKSGKPLSETHRRKLSEALRGEKGSNWKGGIWSENERIRKNIEIRLWREAVFARDNFTCQFCKTRGGIDLEAHHIQNFSQFPELRTSIENGITLCKNCHIKFHKKYSVKNNTKEQLREFLSQI